ncbi:hypothetical protein [Sphingomonas sp. Leaf257]|jgi:hypothetical protein|uniref:hypothetical protein n=1 Tax=Sphingomonas sp. Leaf257 TaxID=1736309 RepID=UPI0006FBF2CE|nr:hypothetical protein [Sphingomonas sp. Leaf257]KQO58409.1 hypothetical protein ASF14_00105 [Sphingomonas sp. Leaf257]
MAISTAAAKAKGRNLQKKVRDAILAKHPTLTEDDVRSCPMGSNGEDIQLSTAAKAAFPYSVECKARAKIALVYDALEQARSQNDLTPVAVIKADRKEALVVMTLDDFMRLAK